MNADEILTHFGKHIVEITDHKELYKTPYKFRTPDVCIAFLKGLRFSVNRNHYINVWVPKKHREFCKTQLKLEDLL